MNMTTAMDFCESNGAHLVTIGDDSENSVVSALLATTDAVDHAPAFIGYTDVGSYGKFRWMNGETLLGNNGKKYENIAKSDQSGYHGHGHPRNAHVEHCTVTG